MAGTMIVPGVVAAVCREAKRLGLDAPGVGINFIDEEAGTISFWIAYLDPRPQFDVRPRPGSLLSVDSDHFCQHSVRSLDTPEWQQAMAGWRAGKSTVESREYGVEETIQSLLKDWDGPDVETLGRHFSGTWQIVNVPFTHGTIGYHGRNLPDDHIDIVQDLAEALNLGYLRYFDLQAAEQRAQEAEIERSLERVRTAIAGMQGSDGLLDMSRTVYGELQGLDVDMVGMGINTLDPKTDRLTLCGVSDTLEGGQREHVVPEEREYLRDVPNWRRHLVPGSSWQRQYGRADIQQIFDEAVRRGDMSEAERDEALAEATEAWIVDTYFENGSIGFRRA